MIVFSLCAMVRMVQSWNCVLMVRWTRLSVSRSIAAVASSRTNTLGCRSSALARHSSCRWPTLTKTRRNRSTMTKLSCWSLWDFNEIWNRLFPTQSMLSKEKKKIHEQREHQISSKATCIRHFRVSQLTSDISVALAYLGRVTHLCFRKAGPLSKPLLVCCELGT